VLACRVPNLLGADLVSEIGHVCKCCAACAMVSQGGLGLAFFADRQTLAFQLFWLAAPAERWATS